MAKASASRRAQAKATQKSGKREADTDRPGPRIQAGRFDPGVSSIKGLRVSNNTKKFAGPKRRAARSR